MRKFVREWMEENGAVHAAFQRLESWARPTEENTKLRLLKIIEKSKGAQGPFTLQFAIDRQKRKIQWVSVHIPLFAFSTIGIQLIVGALIFQNRHLLYFMLVVTLCLVIIFRSLCLNLYQESCRMICHAADSLWKERWHLAASEKVMIGALTEIKAPVEAPNLSLVEESELQDDEGDIPRPGKGTIPMYLLGELIKYECGRPSIFSGDLHETVLLFSDLSGRRPKNILGKAKYYRSRKSIRLDSENARTTHRKYLEKWMHHYQAIGDDISTQKAEELLVLIGNTSGPKN